VIRCILKCVVHEIGKLSASFCSLVLKRKEEGSSELRKYFVLCEVRVIEALCYNCLIEVI
jgi:hypothetical protein